MKQESGDGWQTFLKLCSKMKRPEAFDLLFSLFLTFEERETLASRSLVIKALLEEHLTQREIAEKHQASIAQITRGSNALKVLDPQFKLLLKKLLST